MRILPAGDAALLVELHDLAHTLALYRALRAQPLMGVTELVPAARTLLVHFDRVAANAPALAAQLKERAAQAQRYASDEAPARVVEIPVHYQGEDLPELAETMGICVQELIARHTSEPWQAAFAGFAPGFVYLAGGHASFAQIPRRKTPRTRVPAGSVALAGDFSAVYPAASPGGWQLIGVTELAMWDMARAEPALVQPGFQVRFVDAARRVSLSLPLGEGRGEGQRRLNEHAAIDAPQAPIPAFPQRGKESDTKNHQSNQLLGACRTLGVESENRPQRGQFLPDLQPNSGSIGQKDGEKWTAAVDLQPTLPKSDRLLALDQKALAAIEIINPGLQTLVQDAGRHGLAGLGVSSAGALDQAALRQANRLLGNPVHTAVLENLLGGLTLRCHGRATLAVAGAPVPLTLQAPGGQCWPVASHAAIALDDGDQLQLGTPSSGVRCYVAVRGGFDVAPVLGSCSSDTLAHIGPAPLQVGDRLAAGSAVPAGALRAAQPPDAPPADLPRAGDEVLLDVLPGPRADWFTPEAMALLQSQAWRVTPQSNRIGMRLAGELPLTRSRHDELPSEGTVAGALQVPAGGQPVLFLADHPLTGGYPVIAVLASHHLAVAAQIPVGCSVRFRVIAPFEEAEP